MDKITNIESTNNSAHVPYSGKVWRITRHSPNTSIIQTFSLVSPFYNNNNKPCNAVVGIRQTFFRQPLLMKQFAKLYPSQTFPLYGIVFYRVTLEMQNGIAAVFKSTDKPIPLTIEAELLIRILQHVVSTNAALDHVCYVTMLTRTC